MSLLFRVGVKVYVLIFLLLFNYNFKNADYVSLSNYLCSVNWYLMFSQCNTNDAWCLFKKCLWYAISRFVPIKKPSNSKKRTHKATTPQYLRKLIYKKKKNVEIYEIK